MACSTGLDRFGEAQEAFKRGDYAAAFRGFRRLAKEGDGAAQHNLGYLYDKGKGVPQDYAVAARWYRSAAEQGVVKSQARLGLMYSEGNGVPKDYFEAARWFHRAAEQGFAPAQLTLAFLYAMGRGVPRDFVRAHKWFNLAASQISASDKRGKALAVEGRERVARRLTAAQLARAQRLAREWRPDCGRGPSVA